MINIAGILGILGGHAVVAPPPGPNSVKAGAVKPPLSFQK